MEYIEMADGQRMKQIEEIGYKYLGIIHPAQWTKNSGNGR